MSLTTSNRAVGIFSNRAEAESALNELRHADFDMDRVSIIAKESDHPEHDNRLGSDRVGDMADTTRDRVNDAVQTTHADEGAKTGAATGGAVGGVAGLLVGLGALAIPGVGPIMLAGAAATAIATTLAGGAIGAATGTLVGGLVGLGIPEDRARAYQDQVSRGGHLVMVDGTQEEIMRAETILKRGGVRDWEVYPTPTTAGSMDHTVRL